MGPDTFCRQISLFARLVLTVTVATLFVPAVHAQAKPERQSKAVKPSQSAQTPPVAAPSTGSSGSGA
ncbi:MAG TPA: hypothetical protein VFL34_10750, partial [Candidatus Sulfotelmatobacter sp.]|nr:hypothetical protein [Candidatus Sulfotelmatobacter sp.]